MMQLMTPLQIGFLLAGIKFQFPDELGTALADPDKMSKVWATELSINNAIRAGVLPAIKAEKDADEVKNLLKGFQKDNGPLSKGAGSFIEKSCEYYVAFDDLDDFLKKPSRWSEWEQDEDGNEKPYSHSKAAISRTLWIFFRLLSGAAGENKELLIVKRLLDKAQQEIDNLKQDGRLPENSGLGETTVENVIREAIEAGKALLAPVTSVDAPPTGEKPAAAG